MLWIAQTPVKYSQNNDTSEAQYQLWREGNVRSLKLPAHSVLGLWQPGTEPCIAGLHMLGVCFISWSGKRCPALLWPGALTTRAALPSSVLACTLTGFTWRLPHTQPPCPARAGIWGEGWGATRRRRNNTVKGSILMFLHLVKESVFLVLSLLKWRKNKLSTSRPNNKNPESEMYLSRMCFMLEAACTEGVHFLSDVAKRNIKSSCAHSYSLSPEKGGCQKLLLHKVYQLPGLIFILIIFVYDFVFCVFVLVLLRTDFMGSKSIKI